MMYPKEAKIRVNCQFSGQPEFVYFYYDDNFYLFNGCDNNYHGCPECNKTCFALAMRQFNPASSGGPQRNFPEP